MNNHSVNKSFLSSIAYDAFLVLLSGPFVIIVEHVTLLGLQITRDFLFLLFSRFKNLCCVWAGVFAGEIADVPLAADVVSQEKQIVHCPNMCLVHDPRPDDAVKRNAYTPD